MFCVPVTAGSGMVFAAGVTVPATSFPREFPFGAEAKVILAVLFCALAALTGIAMIIRAIIHRKQIFRNTEMFPEGAFPLDSDVGKFIIMASYAE
jgi:tellurite resistance protein TehA-like permease